MTTSAFSSPYLPVVLILSMAILPFGCSDEVDDGEAPPDDSAEEQIPTQEEHYARQEYKIESKEMSAIHQVHPREICVDAADTVNGEGFCFLNGMLNNIPEGERFLDHGDCLDVRTMGTSGHWAPVYPDYEDERLQDEEYLAEVEWVTSQMDARGCACCHNSESGYATVYDWGLGPSWVSTMSNNGIALAAGLAGDGIFTTLPGEDNFGFGRAGHVFASTDPDRMQAFFQDEFDHRGLGQADIDAAELFYDFVPFRDVAIEPPEPCPEGVGVNAEGVVSWDLEGVRFLNILEGEGLNPNIPPLDSPEGTLWRIESDPNEDAMASGTVSYGEQTGADRIQRFPADGAAPPALVEGNVYRMFATPRTSGGTRVNCEFTYPIP